MLTHRLDTETGIIEIEIDGTADAESYRALVRDLDAEIASQGRVIVMEVVRSLGWISPGIWWNDFSWSLRHMRDFSRVALVTDHSWLGWMARGAALMMPVHLRVFELNEIERAREWLCA